MSLKIVIAIVCGLVLGRFVTHIELDNIIDNILNIGLYVLLFFVGMDIGRSQNLFNDLKALGLKIFIIPVCIAIGSIAGSAAVGLLMGMPFNESAAVGAGFGWYSLSGVILSKTGGAQIGALAFITNVLREVLAIVLIPVVAKKIGFIEAIAPAGATAMDTTLPVISKSTNGKVGLISFITGVVLSAMVPFLVPLLSAI
ncbi:MAG: lysine exporter LysO family protein [Mahellales bacterium]